MKRYSILQRYRSRGNATWYGRISDGGIVKYVSLGVTRRADALEWLNARNAEKFLPERLVSEKPDRAFPASVRAFLESVEAAHGAGLTLKAYSASLSHFSAWAERSGVSTLRDVTRERAQSYSSAQCSSFSPKTARERIRVCRQFSKWCAGIYGLDDWNPFGMVRLPKLEKRRKAFWTVEQVDRILDAAPSPSFRLFWALMAFAGLRHAEACAFGPESLTGDGRLHVIGKGNKEAFLPVSGRLGCEISRFGKLSAGMFRSPAFLHGRSNAVLRKAVSEAGVPRDGAATNHRFRHSFASNLIRAGVNVKAVQQLMRHENVQITLDTYSHLLQDDLRAAADSLS